MAGDELGVLLRDLSIEQVMAVAETLFDAIASYWFNWQGRNFEVTCQYRRACYHY